MLFRPAARVRAGLPMAELRALCGRSLTALALMGFAAATVPAHADLTADAILQKMNAVYSGAKSFKGSTTVKSSGKSPDGKPFSVTITKTVAYKAPNLFRIDVSMAGTGAAAAQAANGKQTVVSDGKAMYMYLPVRKVYQKQPARPTVPALQVIQIGIRGENAKLLPAGSVNGHAAYMVQLMPALPPNITPQQRAMAKPAVLAIDKQNFHLLRVGQPGSTQSISYGEQVINGNLPASTFTFTPPAGAKEQKMPMPGAPGGAPVPPPAPRR